MCRTLVAMLCFLGISIFLIAADPAQTGPATPKKTPAAVQVEVRLADGSLVRMVPESSAIEIGTRFGRLTIPVEEIRRIEFAFRVPEATEKKIAEAIAHLGDPAFRIREAAATELMTYKELAYPALKRAIASSTDAEIVARAEELVRKLEEKLPPEKLRYRDHDVIITSDFPVRGRIELSVFKAHSPHFGEISLPIAALRVMRSMTGAGELEVQIDAAKHGSPPGNEWLATEIEVSSGMSLDIRAAGQVDLYPMGGNYKVNPDGQPNNGMVNGHPSGALLGRIGSNGTPFIVGSRYTGNPGSEGTLYLRIVPNPWGNASSGSYGVKIATDMSGDAEPARATDAVPTKPRRLKDAKTEK